jgi:hypothetical protein
VILRAAIAVAAIAALAAAAQTWRLDRLRAELATAERNFGMCDATLTAYLEGEEIDDAIPLDLDGFTVPDRWRVQPVEPAPAAP